MIPGSKAVAAALILRWPAVANAPWLPAEAKPLQPSPAKPHDPLIVALTPGRRAA